MKKLLSLLFITLLLCGCNNQNNKQEKEITAEEAQIIIDKMKEKYKDDASIPSQYVITTTTHSKIDGSAPDQQDPATDALEKSTMSVNTEKNYIYNITDTNYNGIDYSEDYYLYIDGLDLYGCYNTASFDENDEYQGNSKIYYKNTLDEEGIKQAMSMILPVTKDILAVDDEVESFKSYMEQYGSTPTINYYSNGEGNLTVKFSGNISSTQTEFYTDTEGNSYDVTIEQGYDFKFVFDNYFIVSTTRNTTNKMTSEDNIFNLSYIVEEEANYKQQDVEAKLPDLSEYTYQENVQ